MSLMESARKVLDGYVIEAPKRLEIRESDFAESVLLPAGPLLGQAADIATTVYALRNGMVEGNPVVKGLVNNLPLFAAVKIAVGVGTGLVIQRMENKGHKKIVSILASLAGFAPAISNVITVARSKRG